MWRTPASGSRSPTCTASSPRSAAVPSGSGLQAARSDFLGQFGIGLLAYFVVAERIRVVSRSARTPDAAPVEWTATDDKLVYTVRTLPHEARTEPGTTVHLVARAGAGEWLTEERVRTLARDFGSLLPYDVRVGDEAIAELPAPWDRAHPSPATRRVALARRCHDLFGFTPLDTIDLNVPLAGVRGVAYVLPSAVSPGPARRPPGAPEGHAAHRAGRTAVARLGVLRALRPGRGQPAAHRLARVAVRGRDPGGRTRGPGRAHPVVADGARGGRPGASGGLPGGAPPGREVPGAARQRDAGRCCQWLPFETTDGRLSLEEFALRHPVVHFTRTVEEYRQVAPIASAQGIGVINGGYTYDSELVEALPSVRPGTVVSELDADTVTAHLDAVDPAEELALSGFLMAARAKLDPLGCDVVLRAFHPLSRARPAPGRPGGPCRPARRPRIRPTTCGRAFSARCAAARPVPAWSSTTSTH